MRPPGDHDAGMEAIRYFQDDVRRYEEVIRLGAYGQITTGSLLGSFGRRTQEFSEQLVQRGLVHVVASDAHDTRGRPPVLSEAVGALAAMVGEDLARRMADDIPRALLRGEEVEVPRLDPPERSRSLLARLFRR